MAGERATVRADIVVSYKLPDGGEEEVETREGVEVRLGKRGVFR